MFEKTPELPAVAMSEKAEAFLKAETAKHNNTCAQYKTLLEGSRLRPCHFYPVTVEHDGLRWICQYLGCDEAVGYGDSPSDACSAFDAMWYGTKASDGSDSVDG
jgi:hypothetical protein